MWRMVKGIPHCESCGYEPPLINELFRDCPSICPKCGTDMRARSEQINNGEAMSEKAKKNSL